eukprot:760848-Hanusia_phi.AAC.5
MHESDKRISVFLAVCRAVDLAALRERTAMLCYALSLLSAVASPSSSFVSLSSSIDKISPRLHTATKTPRLDLEHADSRTCRNEYIGS